ncbi:unnamed protein product [Microthlaspi erraticum]|uniref:ATP-dependent DNA helicase n=1 Tax=Microthlaspi erraticum TaxID=1685480 RepID=A0A6D2KR93_9BRAS|nr:unnamed protein product [Microthlaspi erraticum]
MCCMHGKIELPPPPPVPEILQDLLFKGDDKSKNFKENIRAYTSMFGFTSMGGKVDTSINKGRGPPIFRLLGQNFHRIGSLLPSDDSRPKYQQLYIVDTKNEIANRITAFSEKRTAPTAKSKILREDIVEDIKTMLDQCNNPYVKILRTARERFGDSLESMNVKVRLISKRKTDPNTYNMPTCSEVAALLVGDFDETFKARDIVVETKSKKLMRISELHPAYLPLQYPTVFPYGEDGYHIDLHLKRTTTMSENPRFRVSMKEFFAYKIMQRGNQFNVLHYTGKLYQQFLVDAFTMMEAERIGFLKLNQKTLRADSYSNVSAFASTGNKDSSMCGARIVLPSTFVGGPRYMREKYMDAMAVCSHFGYPDLFITFTCNPKWPEITRYLSKHNLQSEDRPDILRGSKLPTTDDIDKVISAEIPDQSSNPVLYDIVKDLMVHGPCGIENPSSPCMAKGKCTKQFLKAYCTDTHINKDGYPVYRRRDDGRSMEKSGIEIDNRFIIPYNPHLLLKYQAHINVEWCNQSRAIKYLFKYINKGNDRLTAKLIRESSNEEPESSENPSEKKVDEIKRFLDCRYISPCEAVWRILRFELHYSSTSIQRLSIHLEGEHGLTYDSEDDLDEVLAKEGNQTSQFLEYMKMCSQNSDAKKLTFIEFPKFFTWNKKSARFYLRILVNKIPGATSYKDLRTVDGITYAANKEACYALGLLDDDKQYIEAINEASEWGTGFYLRQVFAYLLVSESLSELKHVWLETWHLLADGILHMQHAILQRPGHEMSDDQLKNQTLLEIEKHLRSNGSTLENFTTMPFPTNSNIPSMVNRLINDELCYDVHANATENQRLVSSLTSEQRIVYNNIVNAVVTNSGGVFFVNGFGGTGKTFLWKALSTYIRSMGEIVLNVASSGMAALLLDGGRTAHSRFSIPIQVNEISSCNFTTNSELAQLLLKAKLIIWDEAPMLHKHCFEAVDRSLKSVLRAAKSPNYNRPFGGKAIVFGGDFRQVLPVIPKGNREQIVQASLTSFVLWRSCKVLSLTKNMRLTVDSDPAETESIKEFSEWILKLGDGKLSEPNDGEAVIDIPDDMLLMDSLDPIMSITNATYLSLKEHLEDESYFRDRAILCPTNDVVDEVNNHIMDLLPGEVQIYYSQDKFCESEKSNARDGDVTVEFLNSIKCAGVPNHVPKLKKGVPVMLLRNIDQKCGLVNGTRLQVTQLGTHIIEAKVITGNNVGNKVYLPRMMLTPTMLDCLSSFKGDNFRFPHALE